MEAQDSYRALGHEANLPPHQDRSQRSKGQIDQATQPTTPLAVTGQRLSQGQEVSEDTVKAKEALKAQGRRAYCWGQLGTM